MFIGNNFFARFFSFLIWLVFASFFIFSLFSTLPSDAATLLLGINASEETISAMRATLGLDRPFLSRYIEWFFNIIQGDFGTSNIYQTPVYEIIAERLPISLYLALFSLLLSSLFGILIGLLMAWHYLNKYDKLINFSLSLLLAIPTFWCAMLLALYFAIKWQIFPAGGWDADNPIASLFLPSLALALPQIAIMGRFTRIQTLLILRKPFIIAAFNKGCSPPRIFFVHILKNIAVPLLSLSSLQFAFLISGAIVVENIFFLPGIGQFAVQSLLQRDLTSLQSIILIFVVLLLSLNFLTDQIRRIIDPRSNFNDMMQ